MAVLYKKLQAGNKTSGIINAKQPNDVNTSIKQGYVDAVGHFRDRVRAVNYNQPFPMKTLEGKNFYITRTTEQMKNDPNFTDFSPGISAYTDAAKVPEVGNYRGVTVDEHTGTSHFLSDVYGDSSLVRKAIFGKLSNKDLGFQ